MRRKSQLLEAVGMNDHDRVSLLRSEMAVHSKWSFLGAALVSLIFSTAMPFMRLYRGNETGKYFLILLGGLAVYTLLYWLGTHFLTKGFLQKIEDLTIKPGE